VDRYRLALIAAAVGGSAAKQGGRARVPHGGAVNGSADGEDEESGADGERASAAAKYLYCLHARLDPCDPSTLRDAVASSSITGGDLPRRPAFFVQDVPTAPPGTLENVSLHF